MRTTLNLPDDVYDVVRSLADARKAPLGEVVAQLVRKGLRPELRNETTDQFPRFAVSRGAAPITLEQTLSAEDEI